MSFYSSLQSITPNSLYINVTGSHSIATGAGMLVGIVVNSHSSGTFKILDNTTGTGTVMFNTITLGASERWIPFFGARFITGAYISTTGTIDATVVYNN